MNKIFPTITFIIAVAALVLGLQDRSASDAKSVVEEPALQRVLQTRTLRCAYASFEPFTIVNVNTGEKSGIFYDLVNELAERLNLKVEWVEETGYGASINAGFAGNRFDAFCTGLWPGASRASNTLFSNALSWDAVGVFVRADDTRVDGDPLKLNDQQFTVTYIEGDVTEGMSKSLFPAAKYLPMTSFNGIGEYFQQITTKKADAGLATLLTGVQFIEKNPGLVKAVSSGKPIRMYPMTIGLPEGEYGLKKMLDTVIFEMQDDGTVERVIRKYLGTNANMLYHQRTNYVPY